MNYTDLVDLRVLLNMLGIQFKEVGDKFKARCPSPGHFDKKPSWVVYKESGVHKCFSCGFCGPLSHLVKSLTGQSIFDYLKIGNPESYVFIHTINNRKAPNPIKKGVNIEGALFPVSDNDIVMSYLNSRGIDKEFIKTFNLKYIKTAKVNRAIWQDRVCIPIMENGKMISLAGRDFTNLQTPKELYPRNASVNTLFNMDNIDFDKPLVVVEGIMDLVKVWKHITRNVCSIFGVAITERQIQLLLKAKNLIWFPDNDERGLEILSLFDKYTNEEFEIALPPKGGQDPGACTVLELNSAMNNKILSVDYFLNKTDFCKKGEILEW